MPTPHSGRGSTKWRVTPTTSLMSERSATTGICRSCGHDGFFCTHDPEKGLADQPVECRGFGDTDPIADNATGEGRQQNRRCELIVVPSAEEMLDLQKIAR